MINIFQPSLGKEEIVALKRLFDSNWIGKGENTEKFVSKFATHVGGSDDHFCSINSCTEGIFQLIDYLGFKAGDEIILPSISFVGVANAIIQANLKPTFCDVDKYTLNARSKDIERKITKNTKAVILINYGGYPVNYGKILKLIKKYKLKLIIDNACSPFSYYNNVNTGLLGDYGVWSFDPMKILVTGDGGIIYSSHLRDIEEIEKRSYLGLTTKSGFSNDSNKIWWEFDIDYHGRRSITNDIASTIGLVQLKKVNKFLKLRKRVHEFYNNKLTLFEDIKLPPQLMKNCETSYYFYWIRLPSNKQRDSLANYLKENKVYTTFRYYPLHLVKYYNNTKKLINSEDALRKVLCLPIHQALTQTDLDKIVGLIFSWKKSI